MKEQLSLSDADIVNSVVYFTAPWCGPCRILGPFIEELSIKYTGLNFVKVNADEAQELMMEYKIQAVPTVLLFVNGEIKKTMIGLRPKSEYEATFNLYSGEVD